MTYVSSVLLRPASPSNGSVRPGGRPRRPGCGGSRGGARLGGPARPRDQGLGGQPRGRAARLPVGDDPRCAVSRTRPPDRRPRRPPAGPRGGADRGPDRADRTGRPAARGGDPLHAPRLQRRVRGRGRALSRRPDPARRARHEGGRRARARTRRRRAGGLRRRCRRHAAGPAVDIRLARLASVTGQPAEALRLARSARDARRWRRPPRARPPMSGSTSSRPASTPGWPAMPPRRGRATSRRSPCATPTSARSSASRGSTPSTGTRATPSPGSRRPPRSPRSPRRWRCSATCRRRPATPPRRRASSRPCASSSDWARSRAPSTTASLIRFELDHGAASEALLAKAQASLAARPDTSGHDTVAWALYRLGRFDEAATEITAAAADGAADARLLFHRGAIALAVATRPAGVRRSRPRSRSDRRSIRSSAPRLSGSSRTRSTIGPSSPTAGA